MAVPSTMHHDTTYNLEVTIDELKDNIEVCEDYYNNISVGQKVICEYTNGRIKKSLYIKSVSIE